MSTLPTSTPHQAPAPAPVGRPVYLGRLARGWAAGVAGDPSTPAWRLPDGSPGNGRWFTVVGCHWESRLLYPTRELAENRAAGLRELHYAPETIVVAFVARAGGDAYYTVPCEGCDASAGEECSAACLSWVSRP